MVDAPIPLPHMVGHQARNKALNNAKDELRNKLDNKDYDRGFEREPTPEDEIQNLIRSNPRLPKPTMAEQKSSTAEMIKKIKKAGSLSIVSSDHQIEDSPNAGHINENLGRSTAMMAVKTLGKRKGITDSRSRPLGKRIRRRYVYENVDVSEQASFSSEFNRARDAGQTEFDFGGKKYNTMKKGESQSQWKAEMQRLSSLQKPEANAPVPMPRRMDRMPQTSGQQPVASARVSSQNPVNTLGVEPTKKPVSGLKLPRVPSMNQVNTQGVAPVNNTRDLGNMDAGPVAGTYRDDKFSNVNLKPRIPSADPNLQLSLNKAAEKMALQKNLEKYVRKNYGGESIQEEQVEVSDNSDKENSPKEKKTKPEKRGDIVTVNPKLNDDK